MKWVLTLVFFMQLLAVQGDFSCDFTDKKNGSIPELHTQFSLEVVATIVEKNYTLEVREYYDYDNNNGATYNTHNGTVHMQLYDYAYNQVFDLFSDGSCTTNNFSELVAFPSDGKGHVQKPSDFLNMGHMFVNVSYIGNDTMQRGIPVDQWSSCATMNGTLYRVDYYFAINGFSLPSGSEHRVPVRVELFGRNATDTTTNATTVHNIYDYVFYRPGPIDDTSVFEIPFGYYCSERKTNLTRKDMPTVFSAQSQLINEVNQTVFFAKNIFDYHGRLHRFDFVTIKYYNELDEYGTEFGMNKPLSVIHDFNSGVEYVIDQNKFNCTVRNISVNATDAHETKNHLVEMIKATEILFLSANYTYQGERVFEDILCHMWTALMEDYPFPGQQWLIDLYYMKEPWQRLMTTELDSGLVGYTIRNQDDNARNLVFKGNLLLSSYAPPDMADFDEVRNCYDDMMQMKHCVIKLLGNYSHVVSNQEYLIGPKVRDMIASAALVENLRVMDLYFTATTDSEVDVWFTLLDKPTVAGSAVNQVPSVSLDDAFKNLQKRLQHNVTIAVGDKVLLVKTGYLKTNEEIMDPRPSNNSHTTIVNHSGYSAGAMAAVGVTMVVVGVAVGIGGAYLYFKRFDSGIPYVRELVT